MRPHDTLFIYWSVDLHRCTSEYLIFVVTDCYVRFSLCTLFVRRSNDTRRDRLLCTSFVLYVVCTLFVRHSSLQIHSSLQVVMYVFRSVRCSYVVCKTFVVTFCHVQDCRLAGCSRESTQNLRVLPSCAVAVVWHGIMAQRHGCGLVPPFLSPFLSCSVWIVAKQTADLVCLHVQVDSVPDGRRVDTHRH